MTPTRWEYDEDAAVAAIDLVGRSGGRSLDFGYLDDDVPMADARWWATATYRGAKLSVEEHRGPVEALEALARLVLEGGRCAWCARRVTLVGDGGDTETCRWRRTAARWDRGCIDDPTVDRRVLTATGRRLDDPGPVGRGARRAKPAPRKRTKKGRRR